MADEKAWYYQPDRIKEGNIVLRIAVVSLEAGRLRYITEGRRLIAAEQGDEFPPLQLDNKTGLIDAVMASAAIPIAFEYRKIGEEHYVDGGVKASIPISAAVGLGAREIFAVSPVAPIGVERSFAQSDDDRPQLLLDIAEHVPDMMIDGQITDQIALETNRLDLEIARGAQILPVLNVIRPTTGVNIHSSREIEPRLIRINSAYGYMRAFDALA
jgi:predicted acylesterase/phospholipase RssA